VPKPAKGPHLAYRPGLDGLRALAVLGVFLYHARPHSDGNGWLPGGFLGVDLFFVLSGYLITSLLLIEWENHHRIVLLRFWARRARRLFPALVVVVLAALLLSAIFARADLGRTRSDAVSSLLYYTNWHLILANSSYFVRMGNPSLLGHLWSLAVEEQFYVLWPLLLVPGLVFLGRKRLPYAVAAGIAGSAALMWLLYHGSDSDPSRVYYGTDTRAFLLLMGILLALLWPYVERIRRGLPLLELLGVAALGMTIWLFATLQDYDPVFYRGGDLAASFCFAVLIAAVAHPESRLNHILGVAPLRWVGERSYGIYLWHLPIILLTRPGVDLSWSGPTAVIGQAAIIVAAAALSFKYVEQPIRTGQLQRRLAEFQTRRRLELVTGGAVAVVACFAILFVTPTPLSYVLPPTANGGTNPPTHPKTRHHPHSHKGKHDKGKGSKTPATKLKLPSGRFLAMGDSVMLGCSTDLRKALDNRVTVDAVVARQIDDTIADLDARRKKWGSLPKTIVLQIGNNGPLWYNDLVRLKHALRGVHDVIVVNVRNSTSWQDESNSAIVHWVQGWKQAHIADWYGHSKDSMLSDGTHPWPWACPIYSHVIRTALLQSTKSPT
jgi:peptidoglycan/LPS O-acetylase OafA/YrhL